MLQSLLLVNELTTLIGLQWLNYHQVKAYLRLYIDQRKKPDSR